MTAIADRATAAPALSPRRARQAVALVLSASFVVLADVTIVNLATPVIERDLHATVSDVELAVSGYQIAYGMLLVSGGRLGDIFGRRALFIVGFAGFVLASLACGLSTSVGQLIAFRFLQGAAAGLLSPQVLATIQIVLPPSRRANAFAALGAVLSAATLLGPLISALVISGNLGGESWRPIFWINVPIGVVALILARWLVPAVRGERRRRIDAVGTVLLTATWGALLVPLTTGRQAGWPAWAWLCLAAAPLLAAAFVLSQRSAARRGLDPLVPPALWRDRAFPPGVALCMLLFSGIVGFFLYLSIVLQSGYQLSILLTGIATIPSAVGTLASSAIGARQVRRWGAGRTVTIGSLICAAGFASMAIPLALVHDASLAAWIAPSQFVTGAGFGMVIVALLDLVLAGIRGEDAGTASGLLTSAQVIGGGLGVVAMGLLFSTAVTGDVARAAPAALNSGLARGVGLEAVVFVASAWLVRRLPARERP